MRSLLARLLAVFRRKTIRPAPQGMTCIHLSWGPCMWRAKGTTPGYKGSGWFAQCKGCGIFRPC